MVTVCSSSLFFYYFVVIHQLIFTLISCNVISAIDSSKSTRWRPSTKIKYPSVADFRIVGGELVTNPEEFTYHVFIEKIWNSTKIFKCGGAIYNEEIVITTAHCLYFPKELGGELAKPRKIWVTAGTHDLITKDPEVRKFEQVSWASELYPHPLFRYTNLSSNGSQTQGQIFPVHDIALIRLNKRLRFTERVQPIQLPDSDNFIIKGNGTVVGYGRKEVTGRWTRVLRKVDIPLVEWSKCKKVFSGVANVSQEMFCTGTKEGGLTPCQGDSGGGITCNEDGHSDRKILCGIASFGAKNCANFSVYTRISAYRTWIQSIVGDGKEN